MDEAKISEYAGKVMEEIHRDMQQPFPWGKQIPRNVGSFSALHDYCDANEYLLAIEPGDNVPECDCPASRDSRLYHSESCMTQTLEYRAAYDEWMNVLNAVSDEVDRRLRAEAGLTTDVWVATGPGVSIGSSQLYHPWSSAEKAMEEC